MRKCIITIIVGCAVAQPLQVLLAADASSTNFQLEQTSTTIPLRGTQTSTNYSLDASMGEIVGRSSSGSFVVNGTEGQPDGSAAPVVTPPSSGGGGGGGGGGGAVPVPVSSAGDAVLTTNISCPFYTANVRLDGSKDTTVTSVEVNGSDTGVTYPTTSTWIKSAHALELGKNTIQITNHTGSVVGQVHDYTLNRNKPGDINGDGRIDDFDLSLLASKWNKNDCYADFSRDGRIDDFDLSLLVSAWTR